MARNSRSRPRPWFSVTRRIVVAVVGNAAEAGCGRHRLAGRQPRAWLRPGQRHGLCGGAYRAGCGPNTRGGRGSRSGQRSYQSDHSGTECQDDCAEPEGRLTSWRLATVLRPLPLLPPPMWALMPTAVVSVRGFDHPVSAVFSADDSKRLHSGMRSGVRWHLRGGDGAGFDDQPSGYAHSGAGGHDWISGWNHHFRSRNSAGYRLRKRNGGHHCGELTAISAQTLTLNGASAEISDGYHDRMVLTGDGQIYIGANHCTNINNPASGGSRAEVRGCLSIFNTTDGTVTMPPDNGDVTRNSVHRKPQSGVCGAKEPGPHLQHRHQQAANHANGHRGPGGRCEACRLRARASAFSALYRGRLIADHDGSSTNSCIFAFSTARRKGKSKGKALVPRLPLIHVIRAQKIS